MLAESFDVINYFWELYMLVLKLCITIDGFKGHLTKQDYSSLEMDTIFEQIIINSVFFGFDYAPTKISSPHNTIKK